MACVPELGQGRRALAAIPGLPPVVDKLPQGCAFADRCHKVEDGCRVGDIALRDLPSGNRVRCIAPETPLREAAE
jgi:peptide/nickel transport system permease protein